MAPSVLAKYSDTSSPLRHSTHSDGYTASRSDAGMHLVTHTWLPQPCVAATRQVSVKQESGLYTVTRRSALPTWQARRCLLHVCASRHEAQRGRRSLAVLHSQRARSQTASRGRLDSIRRGAPLVTYLVEAAGSGTTGGSCSCTASRASALP